MYEILSILTSGKLENAKVPINERFLELKTDFERTEDETVPTVFVTHTRVDLMPKHILQNVSSESIIILT